MTAKTVGPLEEGVERLRAAARESAEAQDRLRRQLDEVRASADGCEATLRAARERRQSAAVKIVIPAHARAALDAAADELASVLAEWLEVERTLTDDAGLARPRLDHLARRAGRLAETVQALTEADGFTVAARDQLRGRLEAYRAKAQALGRGEDLDLDSRFDAAEAVLFSAPCDLGQAEQLVRAYQDALAASVIEDAR